MYGEEVSVPASAQVPVEQLAPEVELNSKSTAPTPVPVSAAVAVSARVAVVMYEPSAGASSVTVGDEVSTVHVALATGPVAVALTARISKVRVPLESV